jgi:replication initiation and membrane attachment protein DnaB
MYYLELLQKFWDFNKNVLIGSNAIAMYLYLLKLGNDCNGYCIKVSDVEISKTLKITRKTVIPTKEKLRDLGLIQYETKNGIPCSYRLILNYNIHIQEPVKTKLLAQIERLVLLLFWEILRIMSLGTSLFLMLNL